MHAHFVGTLTTALLLGRTHASRLPAVRQREVLGHRAGGCGGGRAPNDQPQRQQPHKGDASCTGGVEVQLLHFLGSCVVGIG
jgi:hypothetical protein